MHIRHRLFVVAFVSLAVLLSDIGLHMNTASGGEQASALTASEAGMEYSVEDRAGRCSAYSMAACLAALQMSFPIERIEEQCGGLKEQTSLSNCANGARQLGLVTTAYKWKDMPEKFDLRSAPAIIPIVLQTGRKHFAAVIGVRRNQLLMIDYPFPPAWVNWDDLKQQWHWDGTMLHIAKDQAGLDRLKAIARRRRFSPFLIVLGIATIGCGAWLWVNRKRLAEASIDPIPVTSTPRGGFTLIELMIVMGVISLLIALLLPAVQSVRESARRATCLNHLHQIGVAIENFNSATGKYPAASVKSVDAQGNLLTNNLSPHVELLPYLDQAALYAQFDRSESGSGINQDPPTSAVNGGLLPQGLAVFSCPSDAGGGPNCSYRICAGTSPWMHETTPRTPDAALQGYRSLFGRKDAEFPDGKSQTAAFSEKLAGDRNANHYTPWRDLVSINAGSPGLLTPDDALEACGRPVNPSPRHFSFGGTTWVLSGYPQTWYNHVLTPNSSTPDCVDGGPMGHGAFTPRSLHPGGVNVLFADGSVRFTGASIELAVWRALGSVNGGETASLE